MNPLDEFRYSTKAMARPALVWGIIVLFVVGVFVAGASGVLYMLNRSQISQYENTPAKVVPVPTYVASMVGLFGCLSEGPKQCTGYQDARDGLEQITGPEGFTYVDTAGIPQRFVLTPATTQTELARVGEAISGGTTDMKPEQVTQLPNGSAGQYVVTINNAPTPMTMTLKINDKSVSIVEVTRA